MRNAILASHVGRMDSGTPPPGGTQARIGAVRPMTGLFASSGPLQMTLTMADHLLDYFFSYYEEQQIAALMHSRPFTAREYRSGHRQSPAYHWTHDDLDRADWALTTMASYGEAGKQSVRTLGGVYLLGYKRGRSFDRAVRAFAEVWDTWERIKDAARTQ